MSNTRPFTSFPGRGPPPGEARGSRFCFSRGPRLNSRARGASSRQGNHTPPARLYRFATPLRTQPHALAIIPPLSQNREGPAHTIDHAHRRALSSRISPTVCACTHAHTCNQSEYHRPRALYNTHRYCCSCLVRALTPPLTIVAFGF